MPALGQIVCPNRRISAEKPCKERNPINRYAAFAAVGAVLALEILWGLCWIRWGFFREKTKGINHDIVYYISAIILAAVTMPIFCTVFSRRWKNRTCTEDGAREIVLEGVTALALAAALISVFYYEPFVADAGSFYLPWHITKKIENLFLLVAVICIIQVRIFIRRPRTACQVKLTPLYLALALTAAYALYQPNPFASWYNLYHTDAYFHSIYRVLHLQPYSEINCGVYGFYGILAAPLVKIWGGGGSFQSFMAVMSVIMITSLICYFYVMEGMVKSTGLKLIGCLAVIRAFNLFFSNIYLQIWPHRVLFAGYMLAYITWKQKNGKRSFRYHLPGCILSSLAIVWNLETGLACVAAYAGSEIVYQLQRHSFMDFSGWKKALKNLVWIPVAMLGAVFIVECYNLLAGGPLLGLRELLFPYLGNPYMNSLNIDLGAMPSAWMLVLGLFCVSIAAVLLSTNLCGRPREDTKLVVLAGCVILCAVQMIYFVNRSVYGNLYIVLPVSAIILMFLTEYAMRSDIWHENKFGNGILRAFATIAAAFVLTLDFMTVSQYFFVESVREGNRDMNGIKGILSEITAVLPENTPGIGTGVSQIYSFLGRDTGYYGIDMPDFAVASEKAHDYVVEWLCSSGDVFVNDADVGSLNVYLGGALNGFYETHSAEAVWEFGGTRFCFYRRTEAEIN